MKTTIEALIGKISDIDRAIEGLDDLEGRVDPDKELPTIFGAERYLIEYKEMLLRTKVEI